MPPLAPCPACARHVHTTERACPFCAAPLPADLAARAAAPQSPTERLSRAALVALGATLALAACGGPASDSSQNSMYGAPPVEDHSSGGTTETTPPAADAGASATDDASTTATPEQPPAPMYGAAPPQEGTVHPLYGMPAH